MADGGWHRVPFLALVATLATPSTGLGQPQPTPVVCSAAAGTGGNWPATSDCCNAKPACTAPSPGLAGGRQNVILAVMDDHGYCQNGFMGGRCAKKSDRCNGKTCSNAAWISCAVDNDCPTGGTCTGGKVCSIKKYISCATSGDCPPDGGTCTDKVCSNSVTQACNTIDDCPPGCGTPVECRSACSHGYGSQCSLDAHCGDPDPVTGVPFICVDGLCSPRARCSGDFECARSIGFCNLFNGRCTQNPDQPCTKHHDCNDHCEIVTGSEGFCMRTPEPCGPNGDCDSASLAPVCTSSTTPLRLNDLACRYVQPGTEDWHYDRRGSAQPNEQTVFTPQIDALAREGAVFPRTRTGGQSCTPSRGALLVGRLLRHRNGIWNNNGDGGPKQCRVSTMSTFDEPIGCDLPSDCPSGHCDALHSIAWWLRDDLHQLTGKRSYTVNIGKVDAHGPGKLSFDRSTNDGSEPQFGKFACDSGSSCAQALDAGVIPFAAIDPSDPESVADAVNDVRDRAPGGVMQIPFFLTYLPHIPHDPWDPAEHLLDLYDPPFGSPEAEEHLGRTSQFDAGLQALINEVRRTCVCTGAGTPPQSLWNHTVLALIPDQGQLLQGAKNDQGKALENTHRAALIINAPEHRTAGLPPTARVLDEQSQFAGAQDLLPTILDYAGVADPESFDRYPLSRNLRSHTDRTTHADYLRNVFYSHSAPNSTGVGKVGGGERAYVVPRPGFVGLCSNLQNPASRTAQNHIRPCLSGADCGSSNESDCVRGGRRCANDPTIPCQDDAACGNCSGGICQGGPTRFVDFDDATCSTGRDCVPQGTCRPPMIKVVQTSSPNGTRAIDHLYDLNSDPDEAGDVSGSEETNNLLAGDPDYLLGLDQFDCTNPPALLGHKLECCLREFFTLDEDDVWRPRDCHCPAELRQWEVHPDALACPATTPSDP